LYAAKDHH